MDETTHTASGFCNQTADVTYVQPLIAKIAADFHNLTTIQTLTLSHSCSLLNTDIHKALNSL